MHAPWTLGLACLTLVLGMAGLAHAQPKRPDPDAVDVSAVKAELTVLTDGNGHFVVIKPTLKGDRHLYYGDGTTFYSQRVFGGSSDGSKGRLEMSYWAPRDHGGEIELRDGVWRISCDKRETVFNVLPPKETARVLNAARFFRPLWRYQAYALARDRTGNYYYVDRLQDAYGGRGFRLWVGQRGAMKPQKMINIVSDSEGDIFATRRGDLRLILDKGDATWVQGKKKTSLTYVPPDRNVFMIYAELGVYNERLGTPCDDL